MQQNGSTVATYTYDDAGHRVQQSTGSTTNYLWDELSRYGDVILETNAANAITASYVLGNGQLIAQTLSGTTSYLLPDAQGSTRALTNGSGAITDSFNYTAFGELLNPPSTLATNYLYTGQQFDSATGLYSLRARYYNPAVGRFLSRDTWVYDFDSPVELNRYVYGANNPIRWSDPSGYSLVDTGSLKNKVVSVASRPLAAVGRQGTLLLYSRTITWIIRALPELAGASCIAISVISDADLGLACDGPIDDFARSARLWAASRENPLRMLVDTVRQSVGLMSKTKLRQNHAVVKIIIDGAEHLIYGVSGSDSQNTEDLIRRMGHVVADLRLPQRLISTTVEGQSHLRFADAEIKALEYGMEEYIDKLVKEGSNVQVFLIYRAKTVSIMWRRFYGIWGCDRAIHGLCSRQRGDHYDGYFICSSKC